MLKEYKYVYVWCLLVSTVTNLYAQAIQHDSVYTVEEVVITPNRLNRFSTGSKVVEIDSSTLAQNQNSTLADVLALHAQVFVKSYSVGGLSTPSFRGMNASQTAILWNGFNVSSPMNGGQDLSLLPVNFVNGIKLHYGGAGALWGSGAMGGTIHLLNTPEYQKGYTAATNLSVGSYGEQQQNLQVEVSKEKVVSSLKFFHHQAENNYTFQNIGQYGKPTQELKNAQYNQNGVLQENYFKLGKYQNISTRFWYQNNQRRIPASMTAVASESQQADESYRTTMEWQRIKNKASYFVRAAYFNESLTFIDPLISLDSYSKTKSFIQEAELKYQLSELQLVNIGVNNTYNEAITKNYKESITQNRTAFFASYQIKNKSSRLKSTISARQELVSNGLNPFTASIGAEAWLYKDLRFRFNASKNYRLPTFNDLYWAQGGNPNLKPEESYNEEVGLAYIKCVNHFAIEYEITAFNSHVSNWIMWTPNAQGIWSPENLAKVWSRGLENDLKLYVTISKFKFHLGAHYQYVLTTNTDTKSQDQSSLNKQLIYTPIHKAQSTFSVAVRRFELAIIYNYVGDRFTTADNKASIPYYQLWNLNFSKSIIVKQFMFQATAKWNNITNEAYQIIAYYPTPLSTYEVGVTMQWNKPLISNK